MTTQFDEWSPRRCLAALFVLAACLLASLILSPQKAAHLVAAPANTSDARMVTSDERMSDIKVYQRITAAIAAGEDYYIVVAREHRLYNYPLKPFFTIRPPTLAWITAALGPTGSRIIMFALIGLTAMAWLNALRALAPSPLVQYATFGLIAESAFVLSLDPYLYFHESWAALLMALSIALRRPDRFAFSITAGLAAVLIRELALPFLVLMAALAVYEQSRREAAGWCSAVMVALLAQWLHATAVAAVVIETDAASQGWDGLGGWAFFLTAARNSSLLELLPLWAAALILPLSLFGWITWRSALAVRVVGLIVGYTTLLVLFARPDNIYWALLIEPFLFAGVGLAALGVWRLWHGSRLLIGRQTVAAQ
jgi:hypothetical protein